MILKVNTKRIVKKKKIACQLKWRADEIKKKFHEWARKERKIKRDEWSTYKDDKFKLKYIQSYTHFEISF